MLICAYTYIISANTHVRYDRLMTTCKVTRSRLSKDAFEGIIHYPCCEALNRNNLNLSRFGPLVHISQFVNTCLVILILGTKFSVNFAAKK